MRPQRSRIALVLVIALGWLFACAPAEPARAPGLGAMRGRAASSDDPDLLGRWLFLELVAPGGSREGAKRARRRLDAHAGGGYLPHLARGLDDLLHGRLGRVSEHFLRAAREARTSSDPNAALFAWYAVENARDFRYADPTLGRRWRAFVEDAIDNPGSLGWRARAVFVEWWRSDEFERASPKLAERAAERFGCLREIRLAGPFGTSVPSAMLESFEPERPGPWPLRFPRSPGAGEAARVLATQGTGCLRSADEATGPGVFYAESYVDLPASAEVIVAAQSALSVWVDNHRILHRDPREWGVWPHFGARVALARGRHRILVKLTEPSTSIRVLETDGRPLRLSADTNPERPIVLQKPRTLHGPNVLDPYLERGKLRDPGDDVLRFVAAELAAIEDQGDIASVFLEPLVSDVAKASGPALAAAAAHVKIDPIFDSTETRDLTRTLFEHAAKKDQELWQARLELALASREHKGAMDAVPAVRALAEQFPEVPGVRMALSRLYGELGWVAEQRAVVDDLVRRFPRETAVLHAGVEVFDARGERALAEKLVQRILALDPDSEVQLERALERRDYATALVELRRLSERRPERKDLAERVHGVMLRAGDAAETWKQLDAAIERDPKDETAWLNLADARYAAGERAALQRTLVDAVTHGAPTRRLADALDLVEGVSELESYRLDPVPIISAYESAGRHMSGAAARVLDYSAVLVRSDGSSRMLEHEIVRIQSADGVRQFAEHQRLPGLVLSMRVRKADGRVLEPEFIADKPTVTLPHLEIGDYVETEQILSQAGDGQHGMRYIGPRWLFREPNVAYARSEFVVVAPKHKQLVVETRNDVPEPSVTESGSMIVRRWRVDHSPAAAIEPNSAPPTEFLPSVQVGWGISLGRQLRELRATVIDLSPVDPRIARIARRIVEPLPEGTRFARAQRLYRWILDNVEHGDETDGRRVVVGKTGNRWRGFVTLCRALGLETEYAVAASRLAPPPEGPISEAAQFDQPLLRVDTEKGPVWLTIANKFAPFGYLPPELRDVVAYTLEEPRSRRWRTPRGGELDAVTYEGTAKLRADGSARLELSHHFYGRYAAALRSGLASVPESRLHDTLESRLVARALRGARLLRHSIRHLDDLDRPLVIDMTLEASRLAEQSGDGLRIASPFTPDLTDFIALPVRQTPLLLADPMHVTVALKVVLPPGFSARAPEPFTLENGERSVSIEDSVRGSEVFLKRVVHLPAGRIQPAEYPEFVAFMRRVDERLSSGIRAAR